MSLHAELHRGIPDLVFYVMVRITRNVKRKPLTLLLLFLCFLSNCAYAQISLCSWNIENFGKSKSDSAIEIIANTVNSFDIVAIVEVVAGDGGAQAVARLNDALNRKGFKWDYTISDPTYSSSYKTERYAFLWKPSKVSKVGSAWLEKKYSVEIDREPYYARFRAKGKEFTLAAFHAITKSKQPETEIKYFKFLPSEYPADNLIFIGDFNCPESHTVFNPLKTMGYLPVLTNQKTSLRQECINGDCLASEFDNAFINTRKITLVKAGIIHFYRTLNTISEAREISDHVPVYCHFNLQ